MLSVWQFLGMRNEERIELILETQLFFPQGWLQRLGGGASKVIARLLELSGASFDAAEQLRHACRSTLLIAFESTAIGLDKLELEKRWSHNTTPQ